MRTKRSERPRASISVVISSGKVRSSRLVNYTPSWMRAASGTARYELAAETRSDTAWMECSRMYSGFVLLSETWCKRLTAGILCPDFDTFSRSASSTADHGPQFHAARLIREPLPAIRRYMV